MRGQAMSVGMALALVLGPWCAAEAQRGPLIGQPAPEVAGGPWINSEPMTLERLRGRVLFVEFWTYG
jgi:hypothetical protein